MTKNVKKWLYGLVRTILEGLTIPMVGYVKSPETFNFNKGITTLLIISIMSVIIAVENYMKKSPWEKQ